MIDGISDPYIVIGFLALPPILASATTGFRSTLLVAGYCVLLGLISMLWNQTVTGDYAIRLTIVVLASVLSVWASARREELRAGVRGGAVMAGGLMLDNPLEEGPTVERIAQAAVPSLADVAIIDLVREDGSIGAAAIAGSDPGVLETLERVRPEMRIDPAAKVSVAEVIRTGERQVFPRIGDATLRQMAVNDRHLEMLRDLHPRSWLIIPLTAGEETIGSFSLASIESDNRFGPGEISFAEELARRAAQGIMNVRAHEKQTELSRTLQESLLPRALPEINGLEVAAGFRPLGTEVGGDFYDVFQLGSSNWAAVVGDVCGKGPEAAGLTSLMRDTLRAGALRRESPQSTLSLLNEAILEASGDGRFCTAAYARFDLDGSPSRLVVCNGGHPPPLLLHKDGRVESIGPSGTLLGIYTDPSLTDTEAQIEVGDLVMLYTDGLFEAPPGEVEGVDIERMLSGCAGLSAEETAARIEQEVLERHGGVLHDDIAILVLRRI